MAFRDARMVMGGQMIRFVWYGLLTSHDFAGPATVGMPGETGTSGRRAPGTAPCRSRALAGPRPISRAPERQQEGRPPAVHGPRRLADVTRVWPDQPGRLAELPLAVATRRQLGSP